MDSATIEQLKVILRRESRSLFQYLFEVPTWTGLREQNAVARLHELSGAERECADELSRLMQKRHTGLIHLGAFPDFTPYNDVALHFALPIIIREQQQLLKSLEQDRPLIADPEAGPLLDRLLDLKRRHANELAQLHTVPHSMTSVSV